VCEPTCDRSWQNDGDIHDKFNVGFATAAANNFLPVTNEKVASFDRNNAHLWEFY
jgi:hypothetical protein